MNRLMLCATMAATMAGSALGCASSGPSSDTATVSSGSALVVSASLRRPQGLYVHVELSDVVTGPGNWTDYLECYFGGLLLNPDVSGIELSVGWNEISTSATQNDWSGVSAAFDQVAAWNTAHPRERPKTIQLIVIPGFKSPTWLLDQLISCDPLFASAAPAFKCGSITITGYKEGGNVVTTYPLPWDATYKTAWQTFLGQLNTQVGGRPELVSLAMGGPTGTSNEMFVPHFNTGDPSQNFGDKNQTYGGVKLPLNDVMAALIANWANVAPYKNQMRPGTNDVFVIEWGKTVTTYASIFQNLTLILTPAEGGSFPDFSASFTVPAAAAPIYQALCHKDQQNGGVVDDAGPDGGPDEPAMSCETTAEIVENFREAQLANGNGKGSQMSGLGTPIARDGLDTDSNFGIVGVRWLAQYTAAAAAVDQIIGGAQFTRAFDGKHKPECTPSEKKKKHECTVEQAEFNVLATAFDDTSAGCFFGFGPSPEPQPLNFMQIFAKDYAYATEYADAGGVTFDTEDGGTMTATLQQLYDQAYLLIGQVSQPPLSSPSAASCQLPLAVGKLPPTPPVCTPPLVGCSPACISPEICDPTTHECSTPTCSNPPCQQ